MSEHINTAVVGGGQAGLSVKRTPSRYRAFGSIFMLLCRRDRLNKWVGLDVVGEAVEKRPDEPLGTEHLGPFVEG